MNKHDHEAKPQSPFIRPHHGEPFIPKAAWDLALGILADLVREADAGRIAFFPQADDLNILARAKALVFRK